MTARPMPSRPDLDQLKRQAKELLKRARDGEATALARFQILPAHAPGTPTTARPAALALHDAQSVIARELGFQSWNALREHVEETTLAFDAAMTAFIEAASDGRHDRAERLLALHPGIAEEPVPALLLGNADVVMKTLKSDSGFSTRSVGPRHWLPLHYVCQSAMTTPGSAREAGLVAIANALLAHGADPNTRFPWKHHEVHRPVLWGAVCTVHSLVLARTLLEAGADPSDGVTLTICASSHDTSALDLLAEFGVDPNGPWATDGTSALYAVLHWAPTDTGARWLLSHGADADPVNPANGETPLHIAVARFGVELVELLVARGADVNHRRADGRSAYAIALLSGNAPVAEWLLAHGASGDVSPVDQLVGACSRGDLAAARTVLAAHPGVERQIAPEHYPALYRAAEANDVPALEALLTCGFDPDVGDMDIGMNALHKAAMAGWPDAVRVLLAHGASVHARDREFGATALVAAAEGARRPQPGRDHAAVGRLLLAAGSPTDWSQSAEPSDSILEILSAWTAQSS